MRISKEFSPYFSKVLVNSLKGSSKEGPFLFGLKCSYYAQLMGVLACVRIKNTRMIDAINPNATVSVNDVVVFKQDPYMN